MLTKNQAENLSDEILAQSRQAALDERNSHAKSVPFIFKCKELEKLDPSVKYFIYKKAQIHTRKNIGIIAVSLVWIFACIGIFAFGLSKETKIGLNPAISLIILAAPIFIFKYFGTKKAIKILAKTLSTKSYS